MARKRLSKPSTKIKVELKNLDKAPSPIDRPREPAHTAEFWRNSYEAERATKELVKRHLATEREVRKRLEAEIERLTSGTTFAFDEKRVVSKPVRKRPRRTTT